MSSGIASLHKILKDETRRKIVLLLNDKGSLSYTELMDTLGIVSTGLLNYHLKVLGDLLMKNEVGQYMLTEKGKLASRLLLEFPEESGQRGKPKWWRRFWIEMLIFAIVMSSIILAIYFLGYIDGNGVYQGIISIFPAIGFSYMIQHVLRDVLSKKKQRIIAKTGYIAGGIALGLGTAFFGVGILFRVLQEITGEPLLHTIFWSNGYLVFSLLIAPTIGAFLMYRFGKKRRFRTANYIPDP
ncbi:helix-turn-helix transcriptional regulator [Candidatus Bathyarchaeota archaeon]|nr:helix-turn-helix transcriptional regulator [Candidatus Bathyarchaeota archaeon]